MKILHLISSQGVFGAENVVVSLAREQEKRGLDVWIGVFRDIRDPHLEINELAKKNNIKTVTFDCIGKLDIRTIREIRGFLKKNNIDLIHSHGYKSNLFALLSRPSKKIKLVSTCHLWTSESLKMKVYELLDKLILKYFDCVVGVSDKICQELVQAKIKPEKVKLIYNGIEISESRTKVGNLRKELNIRDEAMVIGIIGRLAYQKGHSYLFQALRTLLQSHNELVLLVVGDGPLENDLHKKVKELHIENNVVFTGYRNDIDRILQTIDILVMPSLKEGTPIVLLEAMASKKPIIATKVGAIPFMIDDNKSGLLVEPGSESDLIRAIEELFRNKDKAKYLTNNAYEKVEKEFSATKMGNEYKELYESICR